ncbi:MAG: recombinase family protein [Cyanobacteria bacterium J06627_32]
MSADPNPTWQRLEAGRRAKAAKGGYAGYGSPAFGERTVNGQLVEDKREQQIIQLICEQHQSGKSLQQIANWLNSHRYTTKRGNQWKRISVKRVLDRLHGQNPKLADMAPQTEASSSEASNSEASNSEASSSEASSSEASNSEMETTFKQVPVREDPSAPSS